MKSSKLYIIWQAEIICPNCNLGLDLADNDNDDGWVSIPIFNNRWDDLKDKEVTCENCNKTFTIESVEM